MATTEPPSSERPASHPTLSRYLDLDRVRLHYYTAGDAESTGTPVVLLHGGGLDEAALSWRYLLPELASDDHVLAPDWPGYGNSGPPAETPTLSYYADVLDQFLDELGHDRVALVGISMGGGVALEFATRFPDRVDRLVLVDSYGLGTSVPGGKLAYWFTRAKPLNRALWWALRQSDLLGRLAFQGITVAPDDKLGADGVAALDRDDAGDAWQAFQRYEVTPTGLRTAYLDQLPDLDVPTLLVHGERDRLVPVDWAIRAHALLPDAELYVVPGCGHMPPRELPGPVADRIGRFLAETTTP
ncbi:alpha/beta fold hydrolase [Haloarchaeobius sp. DFWS5]|uniref:alpha/beta fold hydrolase n=1 Tax=Haloarchaeobius sp. DFWS5 TaxID=3446114 RepID=UPI003EC1357F